MNSEPSRVPHRIFSLDLSPLETPAYGLRIDFPHLIFGNSVREGACRLRFFAPLNRDAEFIALLSSNAAAPGWSLTNGVEAAAQSAWKMVEKFAGRAPQLGWPTQPSALVWIEHYDDREALPADLRLLETIFARTNGEKWNRVTFQSLPFALPRWTPLHKADVEFILGVSLP